MAETAKTKETPLKKANKLMDEYKHHYELKKHHDGERKKLEEQLEQLATDHPWLFDGKQTVELENGKISWVTSNEIVTSDEFDGQKFARNYPGAVRVNLDKKEVLSLLKHEGEKLQKLGVKGTEEVKKFKVQPA